MDRLLVYADQNVLGLGLSATGDSAHQGRVQWVYSKEHFAEIRRSDNPKQYLDALDDLNAKLLELELDDAWKITGTAYLTDSGTAVQHYAAYCEAVSGFDTADRVFDPLVAWLNGGGDQNLLRSFPDKLDRQLAELLDQLPEGAKPDLGGLCKQGLGESLEQMLEWGNSPDKLRSAFGAGRGQIGSVSSSDQLRKIWDLIRANCGGITSDQFFGFESLDAAVQPSPPIYSGIVGCCAVLDILGFQAERKRRKLESLANVRSDAGHIAMGAFCSAIVSADKRLIGRAKAIYEYKGISTQCLLLAPAA